MSSVIVAGARTAIGKFGGGSSSTPAVELGGVAIRSAVERAGIASEDVDYVIMGQVLQAGAGQITARQAAIHGGLPVEVPAMTINKVCLSGLNAIALADQLIRAGEVEVVVAGGMESMSQAPYLVPKARFGARMGNTEMVDSMVHDGLWSTFLRAHMGETSDDINRELEISREEQDAWAARSHAACRRGLGRRDGWRRRRSRWTFPRRKGEPTAVECDEGVRADTTAESLGKPEARRSGRTARSPPAMPPRSRTERRAVVVMSRERAQRAGVEPLAEIVSHGMSADRYGWLHTVPALAIRPRPRRKPG